jgi:hypothetical protein
MDRRKEQGLDRIRSVAEAEVSRRALLKTGAAAGVSIGIGSWMLRGFSSAAAQGNVPTGTVVVGNAEPPTSAQWDS